jgi:renal tumor antigen
MSKLPIVSSEYRVLGKKGEGTFSEVLKIQNVRDGSYFACKKMKQHYDR